MAKQSEKSRNKNTEILHVIKKYTQILRSRRKRVEMLLKKKVTCNPINSISTFREFHRVAAAMADILMPY